MSYWHVQHNRPDAHAQRYPQHPSSSYRYEDQDRYDRCERRNAIEQFDHPYDRYGDLDERKHRGTGNNRWGQCRESGGGFFRQQNGGSMPLRDPPYTDQQTRFARPKPAAASAVPQARHYTTNGEVSGSTGTDRRSSYALPSSPASSSASSRCHSSSVGASPAGRARMTAPHGGGSLLGGGSVPSEFRGGQRDHNAAAGSRHSGGSRSSRSPSTEESRKLRGSLPAAQDQNQSQYNCRLCQFETDDVFTLYRHANTSEHLTRAEFDAAQSLCCQLCSLYTFDINDLLDHHHKVHEKSELSSESPPASPALTTAAVQAEAVESEPAEAEVAEASPPASTPRAVKLKIRCLPCRRAFSRQVGALAHFRGEECHRQCLRWWREATAAGGQPQSFYAVQCRGCAGKPTYPAFNEDLERHIAAVHPTRRPASPSAELLGYLSGMKATLLEDSPPQAPPLLKPLARQMARKTMPCASAAGQSAVGRPGAKRRQATQSAAAAAAEVAASPPTGVGGKRARMTCEARSVTRHPIRIGPTCVMALGYRPLLPAPDLPPLQPNSAELFGHLALVGAVGNGHAAGIACLACGQRCPDLVQFGVHAATCGETRERSGKPATCPLCDLEVEDLDRHTARHRRALPQCWLDAIRGPGAAVTADPAAASPE